MRSYVLLAMSSFAEFQDHLTDLCEHYSSLGKPLSVINFINYRFKSLELDVGSKG